MGLFVCYEKCTTCKKAEKWLIAQGIAYDKRPIKEENPSEEEIKAWQKASGLPMKKFFNTSGQLYRSMGLKDKLASMTEDEMASLLATDGMLVKRPLYIEGDTVLVGFKEAEWAKKAGVAAAEPCCADDEPCCTDDEPCCNAEDECCCEEEALNPMRIAILGAGGIAHKMARTVSRMDDAVIYAIGARDLNRAQTFAEDYHIEKAYGSYEEMLADDNIDLVYIAVPHSHHYQWTMAALNAGRNVLCEKAFAANEKQAREMIELAESKGLLLTEAIWTRYMPSRKIINDIIASGQIGEVHTVHANLGYDIDMNERIVKPELCGGALLDLSVYTLNFASMVLGDNIKEIRANAIMTETGVDGQDSIFVAYNDGKMADLFTTIFTLTNRMGVICGRKGFIEVQNINNPEQIRVYANNRDQLTLVESINAPKQITGFEYQVEACRKAILEGKTECPEMPHAETIEIMRQMDEIRAQWGYKFPFED